MYFIIGTNQEEIPINYFVPKLDPPPAKRTITRWIVIITVSTTETSIVM